MALAMARAVMSSSPATLEIAPCALTCATLWRLVWSRYLGLPGTGVDCADGVARDIGIVQRVEVEINAFECTQPVGQGVQQLGKLARLGLRLGHADRLKAKRPSSRGLRKPA